MSKDKILDTIKKLIKHEESARKIGSTNEAEMFAAKVHELLVKHNLELKDINLNEQEKNPVSEILRSFGNMDEKTFQKAGMLINLLAQTHFCMAVRIMNSHNIRIIGRPENVAVCSEIFSFLFGAMRSLTHKQYAVYRASNGPQSKEKFELGFTFGFCTAIAERLRKQMQTSEVTAIVLRDESLIKDYLNKKGTIIKHQNVKAQRFSNDGYFAGQKYGSEIEINGRVLND